MDKEKAQLVKCPPHNHVKKSLSVALCASNPKAREAEKGQFLGPAS